MLRLFSVYARKGLNERKKNNTLEELKIKKDCFEGYETIR